MLITALWVIAGEIENIIVGLNLESPLLGGDIRGG